MDKDYKWNWFSMTQLGEHVPPHISIEAKDTSYIVVKINNTNIGAMDGEMVRERKRWDEGGKEKVF